MVSKAEKNLDKMRKSQSGWKRTDVDRIYEHFGFIIDPKGGNHDKVYHPDYPHLVTFLPRHRKVAGYIIKQLIGNIDRLKNLQDED